MAQGKIVFVAPTKPLLSQQVEACYQKMGMSSVRPRSFSDRSAEWSLNTLWAPKSLELGALKRWSEG